MSCLNQKEKPSLTDLGPELYHYLENGDTLSAIRFLEEFIQDNPDNNEVKGALIVLRMQSGRANKEESLSLYMSYILMIAPINGYVSLIQ
jgi:hypothetical protein